MASFHCLQQKEEGISDVFLSSEQAWSDRSNGMFQVKLGKRQFSNFSLASRMKYRMCYFQLPAVLM